MSRAYNAGNAPEVLQNLTAPHLQSCQVPKSYLRLPLASDKFAYPGPLRPEPNLQDCGVVVPVSNG